MQSKYRIAKWLRDSKLVWHKSKYNEYKELVFSCTNVKAPYNVLTCNGYPYRSEDKTKICPICDIGQDKTKLW